MQPKHGPVIAQQSVRSLEPQPRCKDQVTLCHMDHRARLFSGRDTGLLTLLINSAQIALIRVPSYSQRYKLTNKQVTRAHVAQTRGGESIEWNDQ